MASVLDRIAAARDKAKGTKQEEPYYGSNVLDRIAAARDEAIISTEKDRMMEERARENFAPSDKTIEVLHGPDRQEHIQTYVTPYSNHFGGLTGDADMWLAPIQRYAADKEVGELETELSHAEEMYDVYSGLYGSGKTTPEEKATALAQKNRFGAQIEEINGGALADAKTKQAEATANYYATLNRSPGFNAGVAAGEAMPSAHKPEEIEGSYTYFDLLTDKEKDVYNYLLGTGGEETAGEYWDYIRNSAQHRYGQKVAGAIENSNWRTGALIANSLGTGVTNWMEGNLGAFGALTGQEVAENGLNYASPYIKDNLGTFGNVAYDLGVTVGNMLPSMMIGGGLGNASMGISAGGNAYQQGVREGMSRSEALAYGTLVGVSEAYLQKAMGGISRLGGSGGKLAKAASGIENGFLRFIAKTGGSMISEGAEEGLQAILEPIFNSLVSGGDPDIDWSEVAYNALMGGLMGGVFEAPGNAAEAITAGRGDAMYTPNSFKGENFAFEGLIPANVSQPGESGNSAEIRPDSPGLAQAREQLRQSALATAEKNFGREGYSAFEEEAASMDNPADLFGEMSRAYNDGLVNRHAKSFGRLTESQYERMFAAGRSDAAESVRSQMQNRRRVYSYKDAGIDMSDTATKEYAATLSKKDAKALNNASKAFGVKIRFADSVAGGDANAEIKKGIITIEKGNPNPLRFLFGHEITHRMQELAPQEYARLREAAAATGDWLDATVRKTIANYNSKGMNISHEAAIDEAIADYMGAIMEGNAELERFIARFSGERTLLERLKDVIREVRIKLVGTEQEKRLLEVEKRLDEAAKAAAKQAQSNAGATKNAAQKSDGEFKTMFKLKDKDESNSIKSQIGVSLARLNAMEPVANFTVPTSFGKTMGDARKWVINTLKASGYRVERKDFGTIVFDEKRLNTSLDYINNPAEIGAYAALPRVLKRGIKIGEHNNHKGRDYGTVTFAAPVVMNGKRGNMGVVVKMTSQNYYKMHRILMPDGSVYELNVQKNAESTPAKGAASIGSHASPIDSAVTTKVTQEFEVVKVEKAGVSFDAETESASPGKMSLKTWNQSSYVKAKNEAAKELSKALDISQAKAAAYIDDINSIAKMIADDRVRLDYEASPGRSSFVRNTEYGGSIDFSTICKKRRLFTGTFEAIQEALPNTALTAEEFLEIRNMMAAKGHEVSCGLCYVEGSRANMGQYTKQFIERYRATNPTYVPNMAEMNTATGQEKLRREHPEVYEAYEYFMNHYGRLKDGDKAIFASQQKPKMYQLSTEYQGEILEQFGKNSKVEEKNRNGGLRIQSFSDFEIIHLIDSMQVIMDMSRVGLAGQAYTKVPDFAWALGDTGLKINLSLIAKGVDEKGKLILDGVEGMSEENAMALRDRYSDNVGTVLVVFTDRQLKAAMADKRIDYIIPFHRSQWKSEQYEAMGLPSNTKDFTNWQNEAYIQPVYNKNGKKQRPDNYMPNNYWDFSKSGKENAKAYLKMCAENNRRPKFHYLLVDNKDGSYSLQPDGSTDGYWKTLIDFKMYNNDGVGSPQRPVRPDFNMEQAERMLRDYEGGHSKFPAANDVVEEFVSKYKAEHEGAKFSLKDSDTLVRDIVRIQQDGIKNKRSDAEIQADIRAAVQEAYQSMVDTFGAIEPGENAYREVQVPSRTAKKKKVSKTVRTAMEAQATPDEALPKMEELVATGEFSYEVYGDKAAVADARGYVANKGWDASLSEWLSDVRKGVVSKRNTAVGWLLYDNAVNSGNVETAMTILNAMVEHQRNAAQAVQATRILKKLSPETQLYGVQRSVANLQQEINDRHGKKRNVELVIDQALADDFVNARTQEERDEALREIYRDIGRQMPSTFIDKFRAWRYLAMLGNPRTHGRNIAGNAAFAPVVLAKDLTASAIESAVYRLSGGKMGRSKTLVIKQGALKAAWQDYKNVADMVSGEGKYSDYANANRYIEEGRQVFKFKPLEKARRGNTKALEAEDMWFSQPHYAFALAQYCSVNGISAEQIRSGKGLDKAREYAAKEAQKATYRDTNQFSQAISHMGFKTINGNMVKKGVNAALEGVLPFRKTPANILVRGLEYSPLGLVNGIKQAVWDVQKGKMTAAEAIDNVSAGLTGTGLLALGVYLAAQGLIRGRGGDDENEKEFEELMGHQGYALETPDGKSYTLDWLAPEALPFFIGVNLYEQVTAKQENNESMQFKDVLAAVMNVTEPMLEMSCLQSLNELFEAVGYASSNGMNGLMTILSTAATSFLTQALPTLAGQAERITEEERMTTYTDKNSPFSNDMQYFFGKVSGKVPLWDFHQIPYIDAWGRTESTGGVGQRAFNNLLNPAYASQIEMSEMEKQLLELYKLTGEASVLPNRAGKYFNVGKVRKDLTADEYVQYATEKGQLSYELLTGMMASEIYMSLGSTDQVDAVEKVYEYSNAFAKTSVSDYELDGWVAKANKAITQTGIKPEVYIPLYVAQGNVESLKDKNGETISNSKSLQVMQLVYSTPGLNDKQRQALFEAFGVSESVRHYNKALVEQKLREMQRKAK